MTPLALRRIRWAVAGALFALLLWACVTVPVARGATWVHLQFTAPSDSGGTIDRYRAEWKRPDGVWDSSRVYRGPDPALQGVPVLPAGQTCDLYVSQTIAPLTSRTYRVIAVKTNGMRSPDANLCVVATGFPDTLVCLSRPVAGGYEFRRFGSGPYVGWSIPYGDSAEIRAIHQEDLQRAWSARLCALFGFWALRGQPVVCP